jgi:hypothetical protein
MAHQKLDNLVRTALLKAEPGARNEFDGLVRAGLAKLADAEKPDLAPTSRFDLAYGAAHALALAALRWHGYRPNNNRYVVFQVLEHTLGLPPPKWRVVDDAHRKRNLSVYEGVVDVEESMLDALVRVAREIAEKVQRLAPLP